MDDMGILPGYQGVLCHDHWKPYYRYPCQHALCNAHHLRELTCAVEQDEQHWASDMKTLLEQINQQVQQAGGKLTSKDAKSGATNTAVCWKRLKKSVHRQKIIPSEDEPGEVNPLTC